MLDAYIIEKIRRERESQDSVQIPLHIQIPDPPMTPENRHSRPDEERQERGVAIIDFSI